jgi:hypothetical protein
LTDDPYRPPRAHLEVPREWGPAPRPVRIASNLIWAFAAYGLAFNAAIFTGLLELPAPRPPPEIEVATSLFEFGLFAWIAWKVRKGRNFARWVLAVLMALALLGVVMSASSSPREFMQAPPIMWVTFTVKMALQAASLILLFRGEAAEWFRRAS